MANDWIGNPTTNRKRISFKSRKSRSYSLVVNENVTIGFKHASYSISCKCTTAECSNFFEWSFSYFFTGKELFSTKGEFWLRNKSILLKVKVFLFKLFINLDFQWFFITFLLSCFWSRMNTLHVYIFSNLFCLLHIFYRILVCMWGQAGQPAGRPTTAIISQYEGAWIWLRHLNKTLLFILVGIKNMFRHQPYYVRFHS